MMLKHFKDDDLVVHSVEGHPTVASELKAKFNKNSNVYIHNFCVGSSEGYTKIFVGKNTLSSSIYSDKFNVDANKGIKVKQRKLSNFIKELGDLSEFDVTILKANIEGAEFDILKDLDATKMFVFDLYLGPNRPPYGFLKDMTKVDSLKGKIEAARKIMDRNGIVAENLLWIDKRKSDAIVGRVRGIYEEKQSS
jgi:FkbM family methyltransferase